MKSHSLAFAISALLPVAAFAGSAKVTSTFPAAAQRGSEQEVTFSGQNLDDARTVLFDEPGFEVTWVSSAKGHLVAELRA